MKNQVTFTRREAKSGQWRMSAEGRCDAETAFLVAAAAIKLAAEKFEMSPKAIARNVVEYIASDSTFFCRK
ncbi:MAG: hypothetical protein IJK81_00415 [Selenomonadaceae bacterium]|nr:hypothetical protein [Selenomonadaceae bacterium]